MSVGCKGAELNSKENEKKMKSIHTRGKRLYGSVVGSQAFSLLSVGYSMSAFIWFSGKYKFVFFWKSFYLFGKICIILEKFLFFWKNLYFFGKVFIFLEKFVLPENQMNALIISQSM